MVLQKVQPPYKHFFIHFRIVFYKAFGKKKNILDFVVKKLVQDWKIDVKLANFYSILPQKVRRLYRWRTDNNRPINRPNFDRLIGRLIGIGRTLVLRQSITNLDHSMTIDNFARFHGKKWILTIWIFCANSLCSSKSIHCPTFHLLMKANELHRVASLPTFNYKGRFCKNHENVNQWQ